MQASVEQQRGLRERDGERRLVWVEGAAVEEMPRALGALSEFGSVLPPPALEPKAIAASLEQLDGKRHRQGGSKSGMAAPRRHRESLERSSGLVVVERVEDQVSE